jgi:hypothetical protein
MSPQVVMSVDYHGVGTSASSSPNDFSSSHSPTGIAAEKYAAFDVICSALRDPITTDTTAG